MYKKLALILSLVLCFVSLPVLSLAKEESITTASNEHLEVRKITFEKIKGKEMKVKHLAPVTLFLNNSTGGIAAASTSAVTINPIYAFGEDSYVYFGYYISSVIGTKPSSIVHSFNLNAATSRNGTYSSYDSDSGTTTSISAGKQVLEDFYVVNTKFWEGSYTVTAFASNGQPYTPAVWKGYLGLANKKAVEYPSYISPHTGMHMSLPASTNWSKTTSIDWTQKDRDNYIEKYVSTYGNPPWDWDDYDIHHIKPRNYGGTNDFSNLIPLERNFHYTVSAWWNNY
ncbi:HNH endonuclease signature motif containing protein [Paenibacillus turpanensis]|uniref:HNH endonuclease signature motif containing protein n=1 Tax=Paenibacillus turpanensis TaxID=2689078 RepID=UPI00140E4052|nr:HNH endonuclease [Paenibacillus turpanensis]